MMSTHQYLNQRIALGTALLLLGAPISLGQTATSPTQQYVTPIDQGVSDLSPLSASLIHNAVDLRAVLDFDLVYPVPGRPDMLMRQSGALSAVFPFSDYAVVEIDDEDAVVVLIPAGTVFYIGQPPSNVAGSFYSPIRPPRAAGIQSSAPLLVTQAIRQPVGAEPLSIPQARRVGTTVSTQPLHTEVQRSGPSMRVVTISDERYRRYRLSLIARELAAQ